MQGSIKIRNDIKANEGCVAASFIKTVAATAVPELLSATTLKFRKACSMAVLIWASSPARSTPWAWSQSALAPTDWWW